MTTNENAVSTNISASKSGLKTSVALISLFVVLLAVSAWIRIPVGPVPVTLQTMVVFLAAAILGPKRAAIAVGAYVLAGFAGVPVFSGFAGGSAAIMGATGGYIVGFILSALVSGAIIEKYGRRVWVMAGAMLLGLAICYAFGTVWFMVISGAPADYVMSVCVTPFILPDAIKIAFALSLVKLIDSATVSFSKRS